MSIFKPDSRSGGEEALYTASYFATLLTVPVLVPINLLALTDKKFNFSLEDVVKPGHLEFTDAVVGTIFLIWLALSVRRYNYNNKPRA